MSEITDVNVSIQWGSIRKATTRFRVVRDAHTGTIKRIDQWWASSEGSEFGEWRPLPETSEEGDAL